MNICRDCGRIFDEPKKIVERHGLDEPPYEETYGCPSCGGAYTETFKCCGCSQYIFGQFVELCNGEYYCSDCYQEYDILD